MKKCSNAQHPHCTYWVMPGADLRRRPRPSRAFQLRPADCLRTTRAASPATALDAAPAANQPSHYARPLQRLHAERPQLHISGFDPRAAGGRQTLKMELRGMPEACAPQLTLQLQSDLIPHGAARQHFVRAVDGEWRPVFVEFSSRGKEHGQYQISIELLSSIRPGRAQMGVHLRHPGAARTPR
jgi:hypothetical protein